MVSPFVTFGDLSSDIQLLTRAIKIFYVSEGFRETLGILEVDCERFVVDIWGVSVQELRKSLEVSTTQMGLLPSEC